MTTVTATALSDTALNSILPQLCEKERKATHAFLMHLIEFDKRALFREQGYSKALLLGGKCAAANIGRKVY